MSSVRRHTITYYNSKLYVLRYQPSKITAARQLQRVTIRDPGGSLRARGLSDTIIIAPTSRWVVVVGGWTWWVAWSLPANLR